MGVKDVESAGEQEALLSEDRSEDVYNLDDNAAAGEDSTEKQHEHAELISHVKRGMSGTSLLQHNKTAKEQQLHHHPLDSKDLLFQLEDSDPAKRKLKRYRVILATAYMLAMGVCGIVLVALGSTLEDLAENCGKTSTEVGSVFIARGGGAVLGALSSAKLYKIMHGNLVMVVTLSNLAAILLYMPFVTSETMLHFTFFGLGLCTAITDTGCQIMTRKLHGKEAGPWLGANTVAFGISGALVPLIAYLTGNLFVQYCILAMVGITVSVALIIIPPPEKTPGAVLGHARPPPAANSNMKPSGNAHTRSFAKKFEMEITIGCMVFWLIGGKVGITAYLTQYIEDTDVMSSNNASLLIMVLWSAITVGRLAGIQDQRTLNLPRLFTHSTGLFAIGASFMLLVLIFPNSAAVLWVGTAGYGLFNGPTVGYCYDLNNRVTVPSEMGMSLVMFGLNFGASFVPYILSYIWDALNWPYVLIYTIFLSHIIPYPLLLRVKRLHKKRQEGASENGVVW